MKKYILILLTLLFVGFSYAQNKEEETDIPYSKVEQNQDFRNVKMFLKMKLSNVFKKYSTNI